jgi:hypothetical protein
LNRQNFFIRPKFQKKNPKTKPQIIPLWVSVSFILPTKEQIEHQRRIEKRKLQKAEKAEREKKELQLLNGVDADGVDAPDKGDNVGTNADGADSVGAAKETETAASTKEAETAADSCAICFNGTMDHLKDTTAGAAAGNSSTVQNRAEVAIDHSTGAIVKALGKDKKIILAMDERKPNNNEENNKNIKKENNNEENNNNANKNIIGDTSNGDSNNNANKNKVGSGQNSAVVTNHEKEAGEAAYQTSNGSQALVETRMIDSILNKFRNQC